MNRNTLAIVLGLGIVLIAGALVFTMMRGTNKETEVSVHNGAITFAGQYDASYSLNDLVDVRLQDSIPEVTYKVNGASIGEVKKGDFKVEGLGTCRLYVHTSSGPYLILQFKTATVIVNFKDAQKTQALYQSLL